MPIGPGKYDKNLTKILKECGATQGLLMVVDGNNGPGFSLQVSIDIAKMMPSVLRKTADDIERDLK